MNENEFEYGGKKYKSSFATENCNGCAFCKFDCFSSIKIPGCSGKSRIDGIDVIFVEVKHE